MACMTEDQAGSTARRPSNDPNFNLIDDANMSRGAEARDDIWFDRNVFKPDMDESLSSSIEDNNYSVEVPNAGDRATLRRSASKMLSDMAAEGQAEAQYRLDEAVDALGSSNASASGFFSNLASTLSTNFLNGMGDFYNYVSHYFGVEGGTASDHPVWRALTNVLPKTEAIRGVFKRDIEQWQNSVKQYADRAGISRGELYEELGNLAVYEHMPERNAQLLNQWQRQLDDVYAKQDAGQRLTVDEVRILEEFPEQIRVLRDSLDMEYNPLNELNQRTIKSGGYLNGEAARLWADTVARLGITEEEARAATAGLREVHGRIRDYALQNGLHNAEAVANWPQYELYVPVKTKNEVTSGPTGDAHIYDPGRYYHTEGMTGIPDNAYRSIGNYGERIAHNIGQQDLGNAMQSMWVRQYEMRLQDPTFDSGLRSYEYDKVVNALKSRDPGVRAWAERIYKSEDGGGVVIDVPTRNAAGDVVLQRRLLTFDPNWSDERLGTKVTGAALNRALTTASKFGGSPSGIIGRVMTRGTSIISQATTRFNPLFPPGNMFRDSFERMSHMAGRNYTLDDGTVVNGSKLLGMYTGKIWQAQKTLLQSLSRTLPDGPAKQYLDEYMRNGLHYQPTQGILPKKVDLTTEPKAKGFMQRLSESAGGEALNKFLSAVDGWNDYFNNIAPFAHYMTLREAGMSEARASAAALEMMNLYQSGSMSTALQAFYPFVRPTMQSAAALARTFGLAPNARGEFKMNYKGSLGVLGMTLGYATLMPVLREMFGKNENGEYRFDLEPIDNLLRATPVGIGADGWHIKIPNGFGPSQIAVALAVGMDRYSRGMMSGEDVMFNALKATFRNITPQDWPSYSASQDPMAWMAQAFAPMIFRPGVDIAVNKNWMGRSITYPTSDPSVAKALQGRTGTPDVYTTIAKDMLKYTGVDMAPEQYRALFNGYLKGFMRLGTGLMEDNNLKSAGLDETARQALGPALTAMGATMFVGKQANTDMLQYFNLKDEMDDKIRRAGVKITSTSYGKDPIKRRAYWREQLENAGVFTDEEIDKYIALREADNELKSISTKFGREKRENSDWLDYDDDAIYGIYEDYNNSKLEVMRAVLSEIGEI